MQMQRVNIQLPHHLKAKLDALRKQGMPASGFIRNLVEQHFATAKPKGEKAA
jgi:metal-responsive CopG/Arc/MetJ family transcriptional regulator